MRPNSKQRQSEIVTDLQRNSTSPEVRSFIELLGLMLEDEKHGLISTTGDDTLRTQGRAQALGQLMTMLVRPITPIKPKTTGDDQ